MIGRGARATLAWACLLAAVVPACERAGGPRALPPDAAHGVHRTQLELAPEGAAATHYGAPAPWTASGTEAAIGTRLQRLGLREDAGLSRAMRELARLAPARTNIPAGLTDGLLAWAGVADPAPRLVVVELEQDSVGCHRTAARACEPAIADLVEGVGAVAAGQRYGVGVARTARGSTRMIVAVLERAVQLEPIPVRVRSGGRVELRGTLLGGRARPSVEVTVPAGGARTLAAGTDDGTAFTTSLACDAGDGAYQVEILADGPHGVEVAANFPLYCGVAVPKVLLAELEDVDRDVAPDDIEAMSLALVNETRRARGLPELQWSEPAARVARAHSRDMREHGFVGHVSPTTGDVAARLARARIDAAVVRENVARGYGPSGIHQSLMRSPGHRANLLADDVTHVGIGVVFGPPESAAADAPRPMFLTQNFLRPPGADAPAPAEMLPTLQQRVATLRREAGLAAPQWDPALDAIAARLARARAAGRGLPRGWEQQVFERGHASVDSHAVTSPQFDALLAVALWREPQLHAGVGIARGQAGELVMIVLLVP